MFNEIRFSEFDSMNTRKVKRVKEFLKTINLDFSSDIEVFVVGMENDEIVSCGGLAGNILKCVAVTPRLRGKGLVNLLMTELLKSAFKRGRNKLFLFTNPKNREFFEGCSFKFIEQSGTEVMLMENTHNLDEYKKHLSTFRKDFDSVGSIVMNANPFTLGHQYLVEQAAVNCDWLHLFVVREDASTFKFDDRLNLIRKGLKDFKNITIHEGSDYLISKATFPTYFIKDEGKVDSLYSELDLKVFKNHIAPELGITHRFVGHEPHCVVTHEYNEQMKKVLNNTKTSPAIKLVEFERLKSGNKVISASLVRSLIDQQKWDEAQLLVPSSTLEFLKNMPHEHKQY